jgi:hypothetical protein
LAGLGLKTQGTAGEDHFSAGVIAGKDDIVVEDAQDLHVALLPIRFL